MDYIVRYFFQKLRLLFAIFWKSRTSPQNRPLLIVRYWLLLRVCKHMHSPFHFEAQFFKINLFQLNLQVDS